MSQRIKINSYTGFQPLRSCMVGKSYPPEFYSKISNPKVRSVMEKVAIETEEDYQKLIKLLESFNITVHRPEIKDQNNFDEYMLILEDGRRWYQPPPMNPRDYLMVADNRMFVSRPHGEQYVDFFDNIINQIDGKVFHNKNFPELENLSYPSITRVGHDMYFDDSINKLVIDKHFSDYRTHVVPTGGHSDGVFCPVTPGLIISLCDVPTYAKTFPGWEVVYLPNQSWDAVAPFLKLKEKNAGRWWIPGEEMNDDLVDFVNIWLDKWVGYVEETVFDVNMLVIDEKNVICNNYNKTVFRALEQHGVTPHICNFRHRYFWDGGLHCISLDLYREGGKNDYFNK
jgi:hypothetical protein